MVEGGAFIVRFSFSFYLRSNINFFGENPLVGHFFNVLWFAATSVLLFFILSFLMKKRQKSAQNQADTEGVSVSNFIAFAATVLFVAHPIHTEVVANIKGRDEILALFGSLAAVWLSIQAIEKGSILHHVGVGLLFFIGLLSKENAITFVAIVPLIYWFFFKKKWTRFAQAARALRGGFSCFSDTEG
ncbi:MAG: glycosyltransferase family 39 protein [Saprospiraceae bacterium]|nr:glycosyltransferase family 39 protein [Saprospiraceae bacterium]